MHAYCRHHLLLYSHPMSWTDALATPYRKKRRSFSLSDGSSRIFSPTWYASLWAYCEIEDEKCTLANRCSGNKPITELQQRKKVSTTVYTLWGTFPTLCQILYFLSGCMAKRWMLGSPRWRHLISSTKLGRKNPLPGRELALGRCLASCSTGGSSCMSVSAGYPHSSCCCHEWQHNAWGTQCLGSHAGTPGKKSYLQTHKGDDHSSPCIVSGVICGHECLWKDSG